MLCAAALFLSGCGFQWPKWANQERDPLAFLGENGRQTDAPPPPDLIPKDAPDQRDPRSALVPTSTMGVNLETYFLQDIQDPVTRIQRLENVILAMHRDMQALNITPMNRQYGASAAANAPPSQTFNKTPSVPQATEPELYMPTPMTPPPPLRPGAPPQERAPITTSAPPRYQPWYDTPKTHPPPVAPVVSGGAAITGIRVGTHPDKIRLVFDSTAGTPYTADVDNNEHLLLVEMPDGQWQAPASQFFGKTPLLQSLKTEPIGNRGSRAIFELKGNTSIISQRTYPALSGGGTRIVIDLSR